ncbi:MAG: DUF3108 domain-containing protein [Pyrinomonadaceae bacterium]
MNKPDSQIRAYFGTLVRRCVLIAWMFLLPAGAGLLAAHAQTVNPSIFRVGEKLTYNISFGKFPDGGYAELYVVSRGRLGGQDAVEIRSRIKTVGLVSAAFVLLDENRTVFAVPDTGLPLYIRKTANEGPLPKETIHNYIKDAATNFDLVTLLYKARAAAGTYTFFENDQLFTATFQGTESEKVKTDAGDFDTTVMTVQSEFLAVNGIKSLKINFTADDERVPVLIRFKNAKGEFRASLAAIHIDEPLPSVTPTPSPTPKPAASPLVVATPTPTPKPNPYVDNVPLSTELGFALGEALAYNITAGGKPVAVITLEAKERKLFLRKDSLLLTATITGTEQGNKTFVLGDSIKAQVDPETLAPRWFEGKFGGALISLNQTVTFDQKTGNISFGGAAPIDAPIGTHSLLSLIYAMRSFNLKVSKDPSNPVNDTRVAVFWESKPYVFTLRPSNPADITLNGEKVSAQLITINTGNAQLDALGIKVWLSPTDRIPLRFSIGSYQADLIVPAASIP